MKATALRPHLPALAMAAVVAVLSWRTGAVFEGGARPVAALVVPIAAVALVIAVPAQRRPLRFALQGLLVVSATVLAVVSAGGEVPADVGSAVSRGLSSNLAAPWPVPLTGVTAGGLVLAVAVVAVLSIELAAARLPGPVALAPVVGLVALVGVLSAPAGAPSVGYLVLLAAGFVAVLRLVEVDRRRSGSLHRRALAAPRRRARPAALAIGVVTLVAVGGVAGALVGTERWNPREEIELPTQQVDDLSPLSRVDGWRRLEPAEVMFRIDPAPRTDQPWRLVALTRYDGRSWMPSADYRPAGRELRAVTGGVPAATSRVELDRLRLPWLPAPDGVVEVTVPVSTDGQLGGLLWEGTPPEAFSYEVTHVPVEPAATAADAPPAGPILTEAEVPTSFFQLADELTAGAANDYERALLLAARLRRDHQLDVNAPGGHSLLVLDSFLQRERPGREEQFVAAYAVLAAALDLPVRVVVGFEPEPAPEGAVARSSAVRAWPEVQFDGAGWLPFDPVPEDSSPPSAAPGTGSGGATDTPRPLQPQAPEVTPPTTTPPPLDADAPAEDGGGGITAPPPAAVGGSLLVLGLLGYVAGVVALKRRRRRRRRGAEPEDQVTGAFSSGMELLIDLGAPARRSATNRELVLAAAPAAPADVTPLEELADLATAAVFAAEPPDDLEARVAWTRLEDFERTAASRLGRARWARAQLSLRSLRRRL